MKNERQRRWVRFVAVLFFLAGFLAVTACSTLSQAMSFFRLRDDGVGKTRLTERDVNRFVSQIHLHRGNPDSHYLLGCYYQQRGRHRDAIREFEKVVFIHPRHARAYNGMGISYDWLREYPKAVRSYQQALEIDPGLDYVHNNLGYSYLLQKDYDAAVEAFRKAVQLNAGNAKFHNNRVLAYAMKGEFDMALASFERAGDRSQAYYNLASVYYEKGMFHQAKENYMKALDLRPTFTSAREGVEASAALAAIAQAALRDAEMQPLREESMGGGVETEEAGNLQPVTDAGIEVSNGNGVNRMARQVADYLESRGFKVVRLTNADHFNYVEGTIYCHRDYCDVARRIAGYLPKIDRIREVRGFDREHVKVRVLIGKDQLPYRDVYRQKVVRS